MPTLPIPGISEPTVVAPAPAPGPQQWAGAPSAALDDDGTIVLAWRVRSGEDVNVIARSADGVRFEPIAEIRREQFGAAMVERPALVRLPGGWRMYVSCATPNSLHWWIGLVEAPRLEDLPHATPRVAFPGDAETGVKDPVIRLIDGTWHAWICCHDLRVPGAEDRMSTAWATSTDGLDWTWHGTVLTGRPGYWDARGARVTAVLDDGTVFYDGRASKEENWFERTGVARMNGIGGQILADNDAPIATPRYLDPLALPDGGFRIYYEAVLPDESHELRTELIRARA